MPAAVLPAVLFCSKRRQPAELAADDGSPDGGRDVLAEDEPVDAVGLRGLDVARTLPQVSVEED
jgi:hypothetical protein